MSALHTSQCDACGQVDDHPKHHYGAETYHHDCTPFRVIDDMTSTSVYRVEDGQMVLHERTPLAEADYSPTTKQFFALRKLAESGTRGEKLRAKALALKPTEG